MAMGPYSTPLLENNVHIVCTSIEDNGDHWNRTHFIFLESNNHGSLINPSSRKQCSSTRNRDIDHQVQIYFVLA